MIKEKIKKIDFLPVFVLCFCLGISLLKLWYVPFWVLYTACWTLAIVIFLFQEKELSIGLLLILGIFLGALFLKNYYILASSHISKLTFYKSDYVLLKGRVDSYPEVTNRKSRFVLLTEELTLRDTVYKVTGKVLAEIFRKEKILYGQRIILRGRLTKPRGSYSGRFSYREYLKGQKIYSIFTVNHNTPIKYLGFAKADPLRILAYRIRDISCNIFLKNLPKTQAGVYSALLLGDRSQISPYFKRIFIQTGTAHILAISGLHVGIVVFMLNLFLKALGIKRRLRYGILIIGLIFYCLLTGARPSVVRATIMAVILLLGIFVKREMRISYSVSLAALLILITNPHQLFNIGFQLSFASVIAIAYLYPKLKHLLFPQDCKFKILRFIIDAFCISLSAWLGLFIIIAYYFKVISPVTVLANMIIVPYMSMVISTGIILIFAGILLPAVVPVFSSAANFTLVLLIYIIDFFNRLPFAYFYLRT